MCAFERSEKGMEFNMEYIDLVDKNNNVIGFESSDNINSKNMKNYRVINKNGQIVLNKKLKNILEDVIFFSRRTC